MENIHVVKGGKGAIVVDVPFKGDYVRFENITEEQYQVLCHYYELQAKSGRRSALLNEISLKDNNLRDEL